MELPKAYIAKEVEDKIYKRWEASGFFNPDEKGKGARFSMVLPPPNVTGTLHIGHALTITIEDIIVRYNRMMQRAALWIAGTDHASIATEEKFLKVKKVKKSDYAGSEKKRNKFIKMVNDFALENQKVILNQIRSMGASLDLSNPAFTLDKERTYAVQEAFIRMYNEGLIYMGKGKVVNWDPKGQTVVDDQEIEYETTETTLYTSRYSKEFPIAISSTRPETKVGDTAVAVNPDDARYKQYIGKTYNVELIGEKLHIKIIGDPSIDPAFGTGAVGVTPAHSITDEKMASRHNLPSRQVINEFARMIKGLDPRIANKKTVEAREIIVDYLRAEGLLEKEETIEHNLAKAQRSGGIIEPLPKRHQFFVNVDKTIPKRDNKTLRELMREAVTSGKIKILPSRFEKVYLNWVDNLRDWSISRQIWFGHRLPVWYKPPAPPGDDLDYVVSRNRPKGEGWEQFTDTLDTWFSSGLWTFSTLGWPKETAELKKYHPTNVLETGYDILFFWVARMILMSTYLLGDIPFKNVFLHGLIRDAKKQKMSKSKGNIVDPLNMTEKYGTDALRFALVFNTAPGTDMALSEDKIKGMKHFANKLWNIARFVLTNLPPGGPNSDNPGRRAKLSFQQIQKQTLADEHIMKKLQELVQSTSDHLENYRIHEAAQEVYQFVWHEFADVYIEASKKQLANKNTRESTQLILYNSLGAILRILHPFMPFVTEHIWSHLKKDNLLIIQRYPY